MKFAVTEKKAHNIAVWLQAICIFVFALSMLACLLALLGRVEVSLSTPEAHYDHALLLERDHSVNGRFLFASLSNQRVFLTTNGSVGFLTWLFVALLGMVRFVPVGLGFFLMARFFGNISESKVFVSANAALLQRSGLLLFVSALARPLVDFLFPRFIHALTPNTLTISSTISFSQLFVGAVLMTMAYVFHYGISLQDEVDHTL